MKYNKQSLYYEALARLTLYGLFPEKFSDALSLEDRPDLQDVKSDIGVEVTRALIKSAREKVNITENEDTEEAESNPINRLSKIECELGRYSRKDYVYPLQELWQSESELNASFLRKLKKMNAVDFSIFRENDLYIYSPSIKIFSVDDLAHFMEYSSSQQSKYHDQFDIVFINDFGNFFACDLRTQEVRRYEISPEKLLDYCIEAKKFTADVLKLQGEGLFNQQNSSI